jgi:hypothetical protein
MSKRTFQLLLVACLVTNTLLAANDHFVGKWKLNPSRSKLTDEMKVESVGGNKYAFDFGSGNAETVVADGTDQVGNFESTLSVTVEGPNTWKVIRKKDGRTTITATWELSEDGNTLTDHFTGIQANGTRSSLDYVYKRTAGTAGFAGTWESTSEQMNSVFELQIQPYGGDGLSFISPAQEMTRNIKFDGRDYPALGPNLPSGFASSGRRVDARTLQLTDKIDGKIMDTQQVVLSPDLKTLTMTLRLVGQSRPKKIFVFDRE